MDIKKKMVALQMLETNVYEAKVPLENLYNMDLDDQNLKPTAIKQAEGDPDQSLFMQQHY